MAHFAYRKFISLVVLLFVAGIAMGQEAAMLWQPDDYFAKPPSVQWGEPVGVSDGLVRSIYYEGETFNGRPTRVFAYYAKPKGEGPFPAVLLIHGGGGKAFADWAHLWARRGYVALAPDLAGHGPEGKLEDGGPNQDDHAKFRVFTIDDGDYKNMWTWQVIANLLRGHALLAAQKEVDADRIAATGISWGGYLTCILAGVDTRLKAAVPVYGCGFLVESSCWSVGTFEKMTPEHRDRWVSLFDPAKHLVRATCPMLFVNGTNDFAYLPDSWNTSTLLPKGPVHRSFSINLPHGHIFTFKEVDVFIDSVLLKDTKPLATVSPMQIDDVKKMVTATFRSEVPIVKVELITTADSENVWQKRKWTSVPGVLDGHKVSATLPAEKLMAYYLLLTDERGLRISTPIVFPPVVLPLQSL